MLLVVSCFCPGSISFCLSRSIISSCSASSRGTSGAAESSVFDNEDRAEFESSSFSMALAHQADNTTNGMSLGYREKIILYHRQKLKSHTTNTHDKQLPSRLLTISRMRLRQLQAWKRPYLHASCIMQAARSRMRLRGSNGRTQQDLGSTMFPCR